MRAASQRSPLLSAAVWLFAASAAATTVVSSEGFESPAFQPGDLSGQAGWLVVHAGQTTTTAQVQDQVVNSGTQALRLDRVGNSDGFFLNFGAGGAPGGPYAPLSGRYVTIDWDMRYDAVTSAAFGPFFGVQVFDESSGTPRQVATLGVDVASNEFLYQLGNDGAFTGFAAAAPDEWTRYRMDLDFQEGAYSVFINGEFFESTPFVSPGGGITRWTDINLVGIAAGADAGSQALSGTAYVDNLLVRDGLRGDFNNDGVLNAADYSVWRDQNLSTGFALDADADADGEVRAADYLIWANGFGSTNAISAPLTAAPEPTGLALLMIATGALCGRRV